METHARTKVAHTIPWPISRTLKLTACSGCMPQRVEPQFMSLLYGNLIKPSNTSSHMCDVHCCCFRDSHQVCLTMSVTVRTCASNISMIIGSTTPSTTSLQWNGSFRISAFVQELLEQWSECSSGRCNNTDASLCTRPDSNIHSSKQEVGFVVHRVKVGQSDNGSS